MNPTLAGLHCARVYVFWFVCLFVCLLVTESKDGPWTGQFDDLSQDHTHPQLVAITGLFTPHAHARRG